MHFSFYILYNSFDYYTLYNSKKMSATWKSYATIETKKQEGSHWMALCFILERLYPLLNII